MSAIRWTMLAACAAMAMVSATPGSWAKATTAAGTEGCEAKAGGVFEWTLRDRVKQADGSYEERVVSEKWDAGKTAVIVCDMWDLHHCRNATLRVGELAERMNRVLHAARDRGATIIHAPSSCMDFYADHPARKRALAVAIASKLPDKINQWCNSIPAEEMDKYPIDQSDGGEDDDPAIHKEWAKHLTRIGRNAGAPWKREIATLDIDGERDYITDDGRLVWSILAERGIDHVVLMGVHTNMCVLGRPFGLRQMAKNGKRVVLMRDMTDTMYNPAMRPQVAHYRGTDLIVEHIEKYVCPTVTSDQLIGGTAFRFRWDVQTKVVLAIAEPEYKTERTLPALAQKLWTPRRGYDVTVVHGDPGKHDMPGLVEALKDADVLVLSVRRQALAADQMAALRAYLARGGALVAIRTSSHAFDARGSGPAGHAEWPTFGVDVLGCHYVGHHGNDRHPRITVTGGAETDALVAGVGAWESGGSLYRVSPLVEGARAVLTGEVEGLPAEPVAWTRMHGESRVFATSLGHESDFASESFVKLMEHAVRWAHPLPSDVGPAVPEELAAKAGR